MAGSYICPISPHISPLYLIQARDEMAGALAESLVAAVCLPFVMPPKLAQELRKVCVKLPPAANPIPYPYPNPNPNPNPKP